LTAGLLTFPEAIGIMLGTQVAARLYPRIGPRRLIAGGQCLVAVALLCLAYLVTSSIPTVVPVTLMLVLGFGQAHTFMPTQASAFDTVPADNTGAATALYNATRQVGSAVGVAVAATVIATIGISTAGGEAAAQLPFRWALVGCALFSVCGSLIALLTVHDADAAPSRGLAPQMRSTSSGAHPSGPAPGGTAPDGTAATTGKPASPSAGAQVPADGTTRS
jgi:MFS family permease